MLSLYLLPGRGWSANRLLPISSKRIFPFLPLQSSLAGLTDVFGIASVVLVTLGD
jgi:hypothetical protein